MTPKKHEIFDAQQLEAVCRTIGDTADGLTGTEIGKLLADSNIIDVSPGITKWRRLYSAFAENQNKYQRSNSILIFIQKALSPVRYIGQNELLQQRRHEINKRLAFLGLELKDDGGFKEVIPANTVSEAEQRASHFKYKLEARKVHAEIFNYCNPELLAENYFHAVFEAVKSIADRLRNYTGLYADGNALADTAFSTNNPLIKINRLANDNDRSEHLGLMHTIKGLFGLIRNQTAHIPKVKFVINEDEALDYMTMVSFVHSKLDKAI